MLALNLSKDRDVTRKVEGMRDALVQPLSNVSLPSALSHYNSFIGYFCCAVKNRAQCTENKYKIQFSRFHCAKQEYQHQETQIDGNYGIIALDFM